jgi:DNA-binding transcriptional regulator LsrR (DeoR family)
MAELHNDRAELLADIAEMYFLKGNTQHEISHHAGVSRSMVSRMIDEARRKGIVEIKIHHPISFDHDIQDQLIKRFGLKDAYIVKSQFNDYDHLMQNLGRSGAYALKVYLQPGQTLGVAWGTSVYAAAEALEVDHPIPVEIVQLVGALGSHNEKYDGHALVQTLAYKLGGEPYYLNAPFQLDSEETVRALMTSTSVLDTIDKIQHCDIALLGIGSTEAKYSSYYQSGYLTRSEVEHLYQIGATGGVCGIHFDRHGKLQAEDFQKRLVSISEQDLKAIVLPLLGALNGGFINILVTDLKTAQDVLKLYTSG